jgi:nitric oxide reductase large subunit
LKCRKENKIKKGEDKNIMSKAKLVVLIISIVIAVAILPLMFLSYQKFYVEPTLQRYPQELHPYIDLTPFLATSYGYCTLAVWVLLWFVWMGKAIIKTRKTTTATALIIFALFGFSLIYVGSVNPQLRLLIAIGTWTIMAVFALELHRLRKEMDKWGKEIIL